MRLGFSRHTGLHVCTCAWEVGATCVAHEVVCISSHFCSGDYMLNVAFCCLQEKNVLDSISEYFKHEIPEVPYNDEEAFIKVLKEAGLTDG